MDSEPPQPIRLSTAYFRKFRLQRSANRGAVASVKVAALAGAFGT
jgi:hypothetical protein